MITDTGGWQRSCTQTSRTTVTSNAWWDSRCRLSAGWTSCTPMPVSTHHALTSLALRPAREKDALRRSLGRHRLHSSRGASDAGARRRRHREYVVARRAHRLRAGPDLLGGEARRRWPHATLIFLKADANIRVNCVCPTVVDTPMVTKRNEQVCRRWPSPGNQRSDAADHSR